MTRAHVYEGKGRNTRLYPEDVSEPNAFFVKQRWESFFALCSPVSCDLYIPDRFILGPFSEGKERKITLLSDLLPEEIIMFSELPEKLKEYREKIERGKLIIERDLLLPEGLIEVLAKKGKEYAQGRQSLVDASRVVDLYAIRRR
ncbi:MAG: hypothetical protein KKC19_01795 [Nanoarchaeota archaeon]|nr:hypothetical protein [Nanoarchaeota archaeon]